MTNPHRNRRNPSDGLVSKLTNLRKVGRFINPATGRAVNIHKGDRGEWTVLFYLLRQRRVIVPECEFWGKWQREKQDFPALVAHTILAPDYTGKPDSLTPEQVNSWGYGGRQKK